MDFQLQVKGIGTTGEKAQFTFRDPEKMTSVIAEIREWSTTSQGQTRTVEGVFSDIHTLTVVEKDSLVIVARSLEKAYQQGYLDATSGQPCKYPPPRLSFEEAGLTTGELLRTPKSYAYCARGGCGHGDNVHGPFCFAAGCMCDDWRWKA